MESSRPLAQQFKMNVLLSKKLLTLDVNNVPIFNSCHVENRWFKAVPAEGYFPSVKGTISQSELSISQPAATKSCSYDCDLLCNFLLTSPFILTFISI